MKISNWITQPSSSQKEAESVLGTLIHCSLALPDGHSHLPSISRFTASFEGKSPFSQRQPNTTVREDIQWWITELLKPSCGSSIMPAPLISAIEFWVDVSISFGIGVVFNGEWESWKLGPRWNENPHYWIGWAKIIAVECGIHHAIHYGHSNIHFQIK